MKNFAPLSVADAAYIAGFFDGEGSVCVAITTTSTRANGKKYPKALVTATVGQTDLRVLTWIKSLAGGTIHLQKQNQNAGRLPCWVLVWAGYALDNILPQLMPYLKVKRERAEIALEMRKTIGKPGRGLPVTQENVEARLKLVQDFRNVVNATKVA